MDNSADPATDAEHIIALGLSSGRDFEVGYEVVVL